LTIITMILLIPIRSSTIMSGRSAKIKPEICGSVQEIKVLLLFEEMPTGTSGFQKKTIIQLEAIRLNAFSVTAEELYGSEPRRDSILTIRKPILFEAFLH